MINIYTDGGSRGNPGPSAASVFIKDDRGNLIFKSGRCIGNSTNNIAEYRAALDALDWVVKNQTLCKKEEQINFYTDSLLMYSQIIGVYKVKNQTLKKLLGQLKNLEEQIEIPIKYLHIGRELNKEADELVNIALDNQR